MRQVFGQDEGICTTDSSRRWWTRTVRRQLSAFSRQLNAGGFSFVMHPRGETVILIYGVTMNCLLLVNVPVEVVTVTNPVVAPLGTVALRKVPDTTDAVAGIPLKLTAVDDVKPCPRIPIMLPTLPKSGTVLTNAGRPASQLYNTTVSALMPA